MTRKKGFRWTGKNEGVVPFTEDTMVPIPADAKDEAETPIKDVQGAGFEHTPMVGTKIKVRSNYENKI